MHAWQADELVVVRWLRIILLVLGITASLTFAASSTHLAETAPLPTDTQAASSPVFAHEDVPTSLTSVEDAAVISTALVGCGALALLCGLALLAVRLLRARRPSSPTQPTHLRGPHRRDPAPSRRVTSPLLYHLSTIRR